MNPLRHGGGEEKHTGKNGATHSLPAKDPLKGLQMPSLCMCPMIDSEADGIENVQHQFKNNTKDTHRADKKNTKQKSEQVNKRNDEHVTKNKTTACTTRLKEFTWICFSVVPP